MDNIILACKLMFMSLMVPVILGTIVGIIAKEKICSSLVCYSFDCKIYFPIVHI